MLRAARVYLRGVLRKYVRPPPMAMGFKSSLISSLLSLTLGRNAHSSIYTSVEFSLLGTKYSGLLIMFLLQHNVPKV
jgi:hypothetical protein